MKQNTESREKTQNSFEVVCQNFRILQEAKGMTDAEFAAALCVEKFTVRKWKNGKEIPADKIGAAADFFGVTEESLRFDFSQTEGTILNETLDQAVVMNPASGTQRSLESPEAVKLRFCEYQRKVYFRERIIYSIVIPFSIALLIIAVVFAQVVPLTYNELVNGFFFLTFVLPVCAVFCSFMQQLHRILHKKLVVRRDLLSSELFSAVFTAEFLIASMLYGKGSTQFLVLVGAAVVLHIVSFFFSCRRLSMMRSVLLSAAASILLLSAYNKNLNDYVVCSMFFLAAFGVSVSGDAAVADEAALKFGNGFAFLRPSKKSFMRQTAILLLCILLLSGSIYGLCFCQNGMMAKSCFNELSEVQTKNVYAVAKTLDDAEAKFAEGEYTLVKTKDFSVKIPKSIPYQSANNDDFYYKSNSNDLVTITKKPMRLPTDFIKDFMIDDDNRATFTPEKIEFVKKKFIKSFGSYPVNRVELDRIEYSHTPDDIRVLNPYQALLSEYLLKLKQNKDDKRPNPQYMFFDRGEIHGEIKTTNLSSGKSQYDINFYQTGSQEVYSISAVVDPGDSAFQNVTKTINSIEFTK